ncbi:MAG: AAA family ATPase [candidate division WOR-3 bacterium]|nr:AAA family ATPase [candidate division WOR-3 bacterium]
MNTELKWAKEILRFLSIKSQFIMWGNIYDIYPIELEYDSQKINTTMALNDYIKTLLTEESDYDVLVEYEPIYGFRIIAGDSEVVKDITGLKMSNEKHTECTLGKAADVIEKLMKNRESQSACLLKFGSRLEKVSQREFEEFTYKMFRLSYQTNPIRKDNDYPKYNLLFWLIEKEQDIPVWYNIDNHNLSTLSIPKPDYAVRKKVIETLVDKIDGYDDIDEEKRHEIIELFINETSRLLAQEIISIISIARKEELPFKEIGEAIRRYKLGIQENPWSRINVEKIKNASDHLSSRVFGQNEAIVKTSDIIKRSVYNLSGSQYSKLSQRPKGVMFFAGPTGVGKTELAKAVTELIFGSENSYIRFDMSEFGQQHSDQRLIGAPPGFVGYDTGGELTSAVKRQPFSVILFDEIEKAHSKILDIFLQILDDGRLSSGRGETVYFSESLIIFTSNLGVYEENDAGIRTQKVDSDMPYEEIKSRLTQSIEQFFTSELKRPEILNRIGKNIIIFDFIRKDIAHHIVEKMLNNTIEKLIDEKNIEIIIEDEVRNKINDIVTEDLSMGGRGIGNKLEEIFINPLSRALFEIDADEGKSYKMNDLDEEENIWVIDLT